MLLSALYIFVAQLLCLSLLAAYGVPLPDYLSYYRPLPSIIISIASVAAGHSLLVSAVAGVLLRARSVVLRSSSLAILFCAVVLPFIEVGYYAKFRTYPSQGLSSELLAAPLAFLKYGSSGVLPFDQLLIAISGAVAALFAYRAYRGLRRSALVGSRSLPAFCVSAAVLGAGAAIGSLSDSPHVFIAREHTLPIYRWYLPSPLSDPNNDLSLISRYLPPVDRALLSPRSEAPNHIVLIVMECVRADHTPFSGYARNTMPRLWQRRDFSVAFQRSYAAGSGTVNSFPALFRSRHLAGVSSGENVHPHAGDLMRAGGYSTAFFSAGTLAWKQLDRTLAIERFDEFFHAGSADPGQRRIINESGSYYAIDDALVRDRYLDFLRRNAGGRTFAVLHLVATHFPYETGRGVRPFVPDLDSASPALGPESDRNRTVNSYDNSIVRSDALIEQILDALGAAGDSHLAVLTSDHGESFGEHRTYFHGTTLYEEQVRVPYIWYLGPRQHGLLPLLGRHTGSPVTLIDTLPTILDMAGLPIPAHVEGSSLLRSMQPNYRVIVLRETGAKVAVISTNRKYVFDLVAATPHEYDLQSDPAEENNLWEGREGNLREFLESLARRGIVEKPRA